MEEHKDISDKELIQGCLENNRVCQELLYKRYSSAMYGICLGYAKDRDDAKDILQDGFVKVFSKLKDFKSDGSLQGWIRKTIVHTAIDFYRRSARKQNSVDINEVRNLPSEVNLLEEMGAKDLLAMIEQLPDGAKLIFNLYVVEGYGHEEIAKMLGITEGTSKSQFSRARNLLQGLILKISGSEKNVGTADAK